MSVLARLALRALGAKGQVRPRIGGLFERASSGPAAEMTGDSAAAPPVFDGAHPPTAAMVRDASPGEASDAPVIRPAGAAAAERRPAVADLAPEGSPQGASIRRPVTSEEAAPPDQGASAMQGLRPAATPRPPWPTVEPAGAGSSPTAPAPQPPIYRPLLPEFAAPPAPSPPAERRSDRADRGEAALHVSIGRIEVRGEPERRRPAPAPKPGPQLMSLEEYLAKGRRR